MASLSSKIKEYAKANGVSEIDFMSDVMLQDDMVGGVSNPYIKEWNIEGLEKPTDEQLNAYETAAEDEEYNNAQIAKRVAEYGNAIEQLEIIVEQGADALASRNNAIKAKYPKR